MVWKKPNKVNLYTRLAEQARLKLFEVVVGGFEKCTY